MRTTLDLADELLRRAKRRAADEGTSVKDIVERALRSFLEPPRGKRSKYTLRLKAFSSPLREGVDLEDWGRLRDLMDGLE